MRSSSSVDTQRHGCETTGVCHTPIDEAPQGATGAALHLTAGAALLFGLLGCSDASRPSCTIVDLKYERGACGGGYVVTACDPVSRVCWTGPADDLWDTGTCKNTVRRSK